MSPCLNMPVKQVPKANNDFNSNWIQVWFLRPNSWENMNKFPSLLGTVCLFSENKPTF